MKIGLKEEKAKDKAKEKVKEKEKETAKEKPTEKEMMMMYDYIKRFIQDVDDHFKTWNFFMFEWYYPIRNKAHRIWKKITNK